MKIKVSKKTRRIVIAYIFLMVLLYCAIYVVPKVTDVMDSTMILENGTIEVSCEAEGYILKEEAVCTATETGRYVYNLSDRTVVKKGSNITAFEKTEAEKDGGSKIHKKYADYLDRLKNYDLLKDTNKAPISGVFSKSIDGYEKYFSIHNLDKITKEGAEETSPSQIDLTREKAVKGEPVFKISNDDYWYVVCWLEKSDAEKFSEGTTVKVELPAGSVKAKVESIKKEGSYFKIVLFMNAYYEEFCSARRVDVTIVQSNTTGLVVDNKCIVEKNGVKGVYVKTKDGDIYFRPVKVKITDGKQSVVYESIFVNDKYEQVETVSVYQEVLKNPKDALEEDMRKETEEEQQ